MGLESLSRNDLLAQAAFVRAMARALLRDEHDADDVTQETMLRALRSGPRDPALLRGWLWRVASNTARSLFRSRARREQHERLAAAQASPQAPDDVVAQGHAMRKVVDAVMTLAEPYRTTILLRYFHDLSAQEIAVRRQMSVATVRSHVQRALAKLREQLDRDFGQDRSRWTHALLPFAGIDALSRTSAAAFASHGSSGGLIAMTSSAKIVSGLAIVAIVAFTAWRLAPDRLASSTSPRAIEASAAVADSHENATRTETRADTAARSLVPPLAQTTAPSSAAGGDLIVEVQSRTHTPADDVAVAVEPSTSPRRADILRTLWRHTDASGTVRFEALEPGPKRVFVQRCPRAVAECVIEPGATTHVTLAIREACDVSGVVIGEHGMPIAGARILAGPATCALEAARSDEHGAFVIHGVSDGSWVFATADGYYPSDAHQVTARAPAAIELTLVPGAGVIEGRVLDEIGDPVADATVMYGYVWQAELVGRLQSPPQLTRSDRDGHFHIAGGYGEYGGPLRVGAPGFGTWHRQVAARTDTPVFVEVRLEREVRVVGTVSDAAGSLLGGVTVTIRDRTSPEPGMGDTRPACVQHNGITSDREGHFEVVGLPAGTIEVTLTAQGSQPLKASRSFEARPGQTLEWHATLAPAAIFGKLLDEHREPLAGWRMRAQWGTSREALEQESAPDGSFRFEGCVQAEHEILVWERGQQWEQPVFRKPHCFPGQGAIEIVVPARCRADCAITGEFVAGEGSALTDIALGASDHRDGGTWLDLIKTGEPFRMGPLPPGDVWLEARIARSVYFPLGRHTLHSGETLDLGKIAVPSTGALEARVLDLRGAPLDASQLNLIACLPGVDSGMSMKVEHGVAHGDALVPGHYTFGFWGGGPKRAFDVHDFEIRAGEKTMIEVREVPGFRCTLRYLVEGVELPVWFRNIRRDGSGRVLSDTAFRLWQPNKNVDFLETLAAGTYDLEVVLPDGRGTHNPFTIKGNETEPIPIRLVAR